jgi:hypothetical protein
MSHSFATQWSLTHPFPDTIFPDKAGPVQDSVFSQSLASPLSHRTIFSASAEPHFVQTKGSWRQAPSPPTCFPSAPVKSASQRSDAFCHGPEVGGSAVGCVLPPACWWTQAQLRCVGDREQGPACQLQVPLAARSVQLAAGERKEMRGLWPSILEQGADLKMCAIAPLPSRPKNSFHRPCLWCGHCCCCCVGWCLLTF